MLQQRVPQEEEEAAEGPQLEEPVTEQQVDDVEERRQNPQGADSDSSNTPPLPPTSSLSPNSPSVMLSPPFLSYLDSSDNTCVLTIPVQNHTWTVLTLSSESWQFLRPIVPVLPLNVNERQYEA